MRLFDFGVILPVCGDYIHAGNIEITTALGEGGAIFIHSLRYQRRKIIVNNAITAVFVRFTKSDAELRTKEKQM